MKIWEYCRDLSLEHIAKLEEIGGRNYENDFDWKNFAETGNCNGLKCILCPLHSSVKYCHDTNSQRMQILDMEVSELQSKYAGKEVLEWDGRPRWMWVWDVDRVNGKKRFVVHVSRFVGKCDAKYPVICVDDKDDNEVVRFAHCAEIGQCEEQGGE